MLNIVKSKLMTCINNNNVIQTDYDSLQEEGERAFIAKGGQSLKYKN